MDEPTKARFREHGDALETVTKFANSTADDVARLEDELSKIKVWAATMMKAQIEAAATELRNEISDVLSAAHQTARLRAEEATKTLHDLETLMTAGPAKSIRVVRDAEDRVVGALVHEH